MKKHDIEATVDPMGLNRSITVPFNLPETVKEAVEVWGEEVVLNMATRAVVIQLQASLRSSMAKVGDKKKSDEVIKKEHSAFVPEVGGERLSPTERVQRLLIKSKLSKAELLKLLNNAK